MLAFLAPSPTVSTVLIQSTAPLLSKETHEGATAVLATALPGHLSYLLKTDTPIPQDAAVLIAKEMNSTKPGVKRAFCVLAGTVFSDPEVDFGTGKAYDFAKSLIPSLENNLKSIATNPLNSSAGPLEGYIAVSVLLGPLSKTKKFGAHR